MSEERNEPKEKLTVSQWMGAVNITPETVVNMVALLGVEDSIKRLKHMAKDPLLEYDVDLSDVDILMAIFEYCSRRDSELEGEFLHLKAMTSLVTAYSVTPTNLSNLNEALTEVKG